MTIETTINLSPMLRETANSASNSGDKNHADFWNVWTEETDANSQRPTMVPYDIDFAGPSAEGDAYRYAHALALVTGWTVREIY